MRAFYYLGPQHIELRDIAIPQPGPGELLVKVHAAVTCGTDLKIYRRGHPKFPPPFIFGHEFGGEIVETGPGVSGFRTGMRVTANVISPCGTCFFCKRGQSNLCTGVIYNFGAFAEYMILPEPIVRGATLEIPASISDAEAAIFEPLVSVVHAQQTVKIQPGERVVILGAGGGISLLHLQMAMLAGAGAVIGVGHSPLRLKVFEELMAGPVTTLNAREVNVEKAVLDQTEGYGADVVIECAGKPETWEQAVTLCRRGGRVLWFGGLAEGLNVSVDAKKAHYGELTLFSTHGGTPQDAQLAFALIRSGAVKTAPLLTDEMPLDDLEHALKKMIAGETIKVVIRP